MGLISPGGENLLDFLELRQVLSTYVGDLRDVALVIFAGLRERMEFEEVPKVFQGVPIALITAALLAMAFMGFSGLV